MKHCIVGMLLTCPNMNCICVVLTQMNNRQLNGIHIFVGKSYIYSNDVLQAEGTHGSHVTKMGPVFSLLDGASTNDTLV